jgi:hypothetical protein
VEGYFFGSAMYLRLLQLYQKQIVKEIEPALMNYLEEKGYNRSKLLIEIVAQKNP